MKFFKLELVSFDEKMQVWFVGDDSLGEEDFGRALSASILETFERFEDTSEDSNLVKKDYPLFVLVLDEETFMKEMERRGFKKLEADVVIRGDSYSVLWEDGEGKRKITPLKDRGDLEDFIAEAGVEVSEEDPNKLIFEEF